MECKADKNTWAVSCSSQMGPCCVPKAHLWTLSLLEEGCVKPWLPEVCEQVAQQSNEDTQSNASIAGSKEKICKCEVGGVFRL